VLPKISLLSSLLPIIFFILCCTKTRIRGFWVIFFYSIASLISDGFLANSEWAAEHKYFLWNIFTIVEFTLLSYFFYLSIKVRLVRWLIILLSIPYLIVFIIFNRTIHNQYNSILSFISQVVILALCLIYFISKMNQTAESTDIFNPEFLIVIALLLYVACTLFLFIMTNHLSVKEMNEYWSITNYSNILTNILFSTAFLLYRSQNKKPSPENQHVDFTSPNDR
jgi:hypothetical protein